MRPYRLHPDLLGHPCVADLSRFRENVKRAAITSRLFLIPPH